MKSRVLVALDESENALRAAAFVGRHISPDHQVLLLSVVPDTAALCDMNSPGLSPYFMSQKGAFCSLEDKKKELLSQAMAEAKEGLVKAGFSPGNITTKITTQKKGVARDILAEAASGYDMVVLGRRGLSGIQGFLMGSVSHKVLSGSGDIPVVLVG